MTDAYSLLARIEGLPLEIIPFASSWDAMRAIEEGLDYDLAIIDRTLGERETFNAGDAVIELSKRLNPKIDVISFSAYNDKAPYADYHLTKDMNLSSKTVFKTIEDRLKQ